MSQTCVWNFKCPILEHSQKNTVLSHTKPYKYSAKLQTRVLYLHRNSSRPEICREIECEQESRQLVKQAFNRLPAASRACQLKVSATVANTRLHIRTALITRIDTRDIKWVYLYKVYLKRGITKKLFQFWRWRSRWFITFGHDTEFKTRNFKNRNFEKYKKVTLPGNKPHITLLHNA